MELRVTWCGAATGLKLDVDQKSPAEGQTDSFDAERTDVWQQSCYDPGRISSATTVTWINGSAAKPLGLTQDLGRGPKMGRVEMWRGGFR
jgi:hypothetical protein